MTNGDTNPNQHDEGDLKLIVEIWKKTVDVQQHFNDIELRIRNYAVTILAALLALAGFALRERLDITLIGFRIPVGAVIILGAIVAWIGFYFMDRWWYHRLLKGAVEHGKSIETKWNAKLPELALADSIKRESAFSINGWEVHSHCKIDIFYGLGTFAMLVVLGAVTFTGVPPAPPATTEPQKVQVECVQPAQATTEPNHKTEQGKPQRK